MIAYVRQHYATIGFLIMLGALLVSLYRVETVARDTNHILQVEVQEKDTHIEELNFVVNQQAVPAIIYMTREMRRAGLTPPEVLLSPSEPPFTPTGNKEDE
jgi:hypothetical protein